MSAWLSRRARPPGAAQRSRSWPLYAILFWYGYGGLGLGPGTLHSHGACASASRSSASTGRPVPIDTSRYAIDRQLGCREGGNGSCCLLLLRGVGDGPSWALNSRAAL